FSSRRRHTILQGDWSSDVCSSDLCLSIAVALDGGVAVVTIDRQDALNALDLPTLTELRDRLRVFAADAATRVVVLTGAGEKAFEIGRASCRERVRVWGGRGDGEGQ